MEKLMCEISNFRMTRSETFDGIEQRIYQNRHGCRFVVRRQHNGNWFSIALRLPNYHTGQIIVDNVEKAIVCARQTIELIYNK